MNSSENFILMYGMFQYHRSQTIILICFNFFQLFSEQIWRQYPESCTGGLAFWINKSFQTPRILAVDFYCASRLPRPFPFTPLQKNASLQTLLSFTDQESNINQGLRKKNSNLASHYRDMIPGSNTRVGPQKEAEYTT